MQAAFFSNLFYLGGGGNRAEPLKKKQDALK